MNFREYVIDPIRNSLGVVFHPRGNTQKCVSFCLQVLAVAGLALLASRYGMGWYTNDFSRNFTLAGGTFSGIFVIGKIISLCLGGKEQSKVIDSRKSRTGEVWETQNVTTESEESDDGGHLYPEFDSQGSPRLRVDKCNEVFSTQYDPSSSSTPGKKVVVSPTQDSRKDRKSEIFKTQYEPSEPASSSGKEGSGNGTGDSTPKHRIYAVRQTFVEDLYNLTCTPSSDLSSALRAEEDEDAEFPGRSSDIAELRVLPTSPELSHTQVEDTLVADRETTSLEVIDASPTFPRQVGFIIKV